MKIDLFVDQGGGDTIPYFNDKCMALFLPLVVHERENILRLVLKRVVNLKKKFKMWQS